MDALAHDADTLDWADAFRAYDAVSAYDALSLGMGGAHEAEMATEEVSENEDEIAMLAVPTK